MLLRAVIGLCVCLTLRAAFPQTPARETPPDTRAYSAAYVITDPEQRIAALLKFKADFPESPLLAGADQAILSTLIKKLPGQTDRIRHFASETFRRAPRNSRAAVAITIAGQLLNADLLLPEAREYALRSVTSQTMASYVREQLAAYEHRGQTPPWSQEFERRYRELRAGRTITLGRIEWKLGHTAEAQRVLEAAHAILPANIAAQATLGELAAKSGDLTKALDYLIPAQLSGNSTKEGTAALESIYRRQHGDSLAGFDAFLDAEYRKRVPNPVRAAPRPPAATRSDRVALAEVFTGSGCPPCAAPDLAFDAAMQRYSRKELAVLMYHQHIPRPDPMANPDTVARNRWFGLPGVPAFFIDSRRTLGGGPREAAQDAYDRIVPAIERLLETPAEAVIRADASLTGNTVRVKAAVDKVSSDSPQLRVQIALVEKELRFTGENGVRFHPMVVRSLGGKDGSGFPLSPATNTFEQTFDLQSLSSNLKRYLDSYEAAGYRGEPYAFAEKKHQIQPGDLAVVVFVQDDETRHVLQAAYVDLGSGSAPVTEAGNRQ